MAYTAEPLITKSVDDSGDAHFTVRWSPLQKVDKYTIVRSVPAVAGIFELYYKDNHHKLVRFYIAKVWIGGLRSHLRRITDPLLNEDEKWQKVLDERTCYFRYSVCQSYKDMSDVLYFFSETIYPNESRTDNSNRYPGISVHEISPDKIVDI